MSKMYKRRTKGSSLKVSSGSTSDNKAKSSIGSTRSHIHGSDIVAPNNTSLIVQRSRISEEPDDDPLPKSITAILYEDDSSNESLDLARPSTSIYNSLHARTQSTPQKKNVEKTRGSVVNSGPSQVGSQAPFRNPAPDNSFFLVTIASCGADNIPDEGSYRLTEDQAVFVRKLNSKISEDTCVDRFILSLSEYWSVNDNLKKLVMLTQTAEECEVARGPVQEPLLRLLLMVDCLQSKILELLLQKITNITESAKLAESERAGLVSGLLRQARCLNRVTPTLRFGSQLMALADKSSPIIAKEIIFLLPELIIQEERPDVASQLVSRLHNAKETTPYVIDCLGNLCLNESTKAHVRDEILERLGRYPLIFLPSIVNFVLSRVESSCAVQVVAAMRTNLLSSTIQRPTLEGQAGEKNAEILCNIIENLKNSTMASKCLADAWLKEIAAVSTPVDARPIDLIMLCIIHGFLIGRKNSVVAITKHRIRAGVISDALVSETCKIMRPVILGNHREVLDFSSALLKSFEPNVADFAVTLFKEIFVASGEFLRQDVVSEIVMHLTTGASATVRNALVMLARMRETDKNALNEHASSFMSALRTLPKLDLPLARQLADIVTSLVITLEQEDSGLIEELLIFIRKQISSWQADVQHRGVVAAVVAIKNASLNVKDENFHDKFEFQFLLKMAAGAPTSGGARRGFFFDELASIMSSVPARPAFLNSWGDRVYSFMLQHYFASNLDLECDHFPMSLQYSIDNAGNLVFPIVMFVTKPEDNPYVDVWSLPSALRLLWCSEKNLSRIDEMLSAAVILPDPNVYDKWLSFSPSTQKMIMDCLFMCANYFIECINAMSSVKPSEKIIIRVKQLIEVRKLIVKLIGQVPEYVPPLCQFHVKVPKIVTKSAAGPSKKTQGRKRKSDGAAIENANSTHLDTSAIPATAAAAPAEAIAQLAPSQRNTDLAAYAGHFRELSSKTYRLLRMDLVLVPTKIFKKKKHSDAIVADVSWSYRPEDKPELGPSDTLFLLEDYLIKSDGLLREKPPFLLKKGSGLMFESITSSMFISACVKLLPKFCLKLDVACRYCKDLLEANDGMWDASGCFPADSAEIKNCYCALLNIISDIVAWKGFQNPKYQKYISETMATLARKNNTGMTQSSSSMAIEAAHVLAGFCDSVPLLWGGVCLTKAIHSCIQLSGSKDFTLVSEVCGKLLKRPWFSTTGCRDAGATYNQHVDSLVRLRLACVPDRLQTVKSMAELVNEELPDLVGKDAAFPSFSALTRSNFAVLYRAMCEALVSATAAEQTRRSGNDEEVIRLWSDVTKILTLLVNVAKASSTRAILAALLKRSQAIISQFLAKGLPVMEAALRIKSEEVLGVLKSLQGVTRFFNAVCCHSKVTKDAVIAANVPHIRALCERLTLEVKGILILNKIPLDCITISVLRNRDLQGNDIISQTTTMSATDDESELPDEDENYVAPEDLDMTDADNIDDD